jgi:VIT1/CCC1 family predicted Fe2+/Mn2+ transporter
MRRPHLETHRTSRIGWLRAAVLGANDGTISVSSLMVGVAASGAGGGAILLTGVAGLAAGAMSMAAGEYVSVKSQADTEQADLAKESQELAEEPERELAELTAIYVHRGLDRELAAHVARQLTAHDALAAHARDELGITDTLMARPLQAALASAASFSVGGAIPLLTALLVPSRWTAAACTATALLSLAAFGAAAAAVGGASPWRGAARVATWGALAMGVTALVGRLFGTSA